MVERVADQVVQRGFELFEDVAGDPRRLADDLELRLLAQLAREVADQTGEPAQAVGQRAHPAGEDLVMEPAGEVFAAAGEVLDLLHLGVEQLAATARLGLRPGQQLQVDGAGAGGVGADAVLEALEGGQQGRMLALDREQRIDERPELSRLDERFPGQAHQPREAFRRHPHHPVGLLGGGGGSWGGDGLGEGVGSDSPPGVELGPGRRPAQGATGTGFGRFGRPVGLFAP